MNIHKEPEAERVIFRKWITRNGKRIYAFEYGLKAFPIIVRY